MSKMVMGREVLKALRDQFDGIMNDYGPDVYLFIGMMQIKWHVGKGYSVMYPVSRWRFIDPLLDFRMRFRTRFRKRFKQNQTDELNQCVAELVALDVLESMGGRG
jgi:hypothetical protein